MMAAVSYADGIVLGSDKINPELLEFVRQTKKNIIEYAPIEEQVEKLNALYDKIIIPVED